MPKLEAHKLKNQFMSTAPINFQSMKYPSMKNKLKIKESKAELKHYSH